MTACESQGQELSRAEVLAEVAWNAARAALSGKDDPSVTTWAQVTEPHRAAFLAVGLAVAAKASELNAGRGGALTPRDFENICTAGATKGAGYEVAHLRAHALEQGRTVAALEAEVRHLNAVIQNDEMTKRARAVESSMATLRQAVEEACRHLVLSDRPEDQQAREALDAVLAGLPEFAAPAEHPDTRTLPLGITSLRAQRNGRHALTATLDGVPVRLMGDYSQQASRTLFVDLFRAARVTLVVEPPQL